MFPVFLPPSVKLQERDSQPLLVDLRKTSCDAARNRAPHVKLVGDIGDERDDLTFVKHRGEELHIEEVLTPQVRVVTDNNVPFFEVHARVQEARPPSRAG